MNTTTMTPSAMLDEINARLSEVGGTAFMVCKGASHAIVDIPDAFVIEAGYALQREIEAIRDLALKVSGMIPVNYAAPAAAAPDAAPATEQAGPSFNEQEIAEIVAALERLPFELRNRLADLIEGMAGGQQQREHAA